MGKVCLEADGDLSTPPNKKRKVFQSFKGLAYLASANFIARLFILLDNFANSFFSYEMVLLYGAHLDTLILLFFKAVFMIPIALLGILVFVGIEKESFNLVLYPTLMLLFLILMRYGAELALLIIHWEQHWDDRGPSLLLYLILDLCSLTVLFLYVYFSLAAPPPRAVLGQDGALILSPSRANSLRRKLARFSAKSSEKDVEANNHGPSIVGAVLKRKKKPPADPPADEKESDLDPLTPPPRPPPSPKFNYKLRRAIGAGSEQILKLDKQRERNSQILVQGEEESARKSPNTLRGQSLKHYESEPKRRSLIVETDLDLESDEKEKSQAEIQNEIQRHDQDPVEEIEAEVHVDFTMKAPTFKKETKTEVEVEESLHAQLETVEENSKNGEGEEESEWEYEVEEEGDEKKENTKENVENQNEQDEVGVTEVSATGYKITAV